MKKNKSSSYVLTLQLKTERYQEYIINKRLEIARNISNSLTGKVLKRYNLMLESKEYRKIKKELNPINKNYHNSTDNKSKKLLDKDRKILYKQLEELYLKYGLSQYSLYDDVKPMYKHFKDNIGSLESQAIADRVWTKFDKLLYGNGNRVTFSRYNEYNSIENKWNKRGNELYWCSYNSRDEENKKYNKLALKCGKRIGVFKDNILLNIFDSCHDLDRKSKEEFGVKLGDSMISSVCNGIYKKYKGFTFRYIADLTEEEYIKYDIENKLKELNKVS